MLGGDGVVQQSIYTNSAHCVLEITLLRNGANEKSKGRATRTRERKFVARNVKSNDKDNKFLNTKQCKDT